MALQKLLMVICILYSVRRISVRSPQTQDQTETLLCVAATLTSSQIKLAELKQWILKAEILWGFLYSSENGDNSMFAGFNQQKESYALMRFEIVCIPGSNCIESLIHFQTRKSIWWSSVLSNPTCSTSTCNWRHFSFVKVENITQYIKSQESSVWNSYQRNPF